MVFEKLGTWLNNFIGKSLESTIKDFKLSGGNVLSTLFKDSDTIALQKFNKELKNGVNNHIAYRDVMKNASLAAQKNALSYIKCQNDLKRYNAQLNANKITQEEYNTRVDTTKAKMATLGVETQTLTIKEKVLNATTKVLAVGFQLVKAAVATIAFSLIISGITKLVNKQKELAEQIKENTDKAKEYSETIDDLIDKYSEFANKTSYTTEEKETLLDIQNQLVSIFGQEASAIDLVNGKYEEQIKTIQNLNKKN